MVEQVRNLAELLGSVFHPPGVSGVRISKSCISIPLSIPECLIAIPVEKKPEEGKEIRVDLGISAPSRDAVGENTSDLLTSRLDHRLPALNTALRLDRHLDSTLPVAQLDQPVNSALPARVDILLLLSITCWADSFFEWLHVTQRASHRKIYFQNRINCVQDIVVSILHLSFPTLLGTAN